MSKSAAVEPLLSVAGLAATIESHSVLTEIDFEVATGRTTVILGRNGAGKTSTLRAVMGLLDSYTGEVRFRGEDVSGLSTHELVGRGIAFVPEDRGIFTQLTVLENLAIANPDRASWERVLQLFPILADRGKQRAGQLSGGQQQMLTVGRALVQSPRLLILDEPSKGLAPLVVKELFDTLKTLTDMTTILLVEQNLAAARWIGDDFVVIDDGVTVASGRVDSIEDDDEIIERFLTLSTDQKGA